MAVLPPALGYYQFTPHFVNNNCCQKKISRDMIMDCIEIRVWGLQEVEKTPGEGGCPDFAKSQ